MIRVNGQPTDKVAANDRGLAYGDGVFRTLRVRAGQPVCWRLHLDKLREDCARLAITCPEEALLREDLAEAARGLPDGVAKIIITRGAGLRGYAPSSPVEPTRVVMLSPLPDYPAHYASEGVKLHLCDLRLAEQPRLAGIKHLNRLENVLARAEWRDADVPEGVLRDAHDHLVSGTMSNLFLLRKGKLYTSGLNRCGVAGVTRARILALAAELPVSLEIRDIPFAWLEESDEILFCNSVIGVWQGRELAGRRWGRGALTPKIRQLLAEHDD